MASSSKGETKSKEPAESAPASSAQAKKLYRSGKNKIIAGICGGIGEYLDMDPNIVRVLWIIGTLFLAGLGGIIAYLILWYIIPPNPNHDWSTPAPKN